MLHHYNLVAICPHEGFSGYSNSGKTFVISSSLILLSSFNFALIFMVSKFNFEILAKASINDLFLSAFNLLLSTYSFYSSLSNLAPITAFLHEVQTHSIDEYDRFWLKSCSSQPFLIRGAELSECNILWVAAGAETKLSQLSFGSGFMVTNWSIILKIPFIGKLCKSGCLIHESFMNIIIIWA